MSKGHLLRLVTPAPCDPPLRSPRRSDLFIAVALAVTAGVETVLRRDAWIVAVLAVALLSAALVATRRIWPFASLVTLYLSHGLLQAAADATGTPYEGFPSSAVSGLMVTFAAVRWSTPRKSLLAFALATVLTTAGGIVNRTVPTSEALFGGLFAVVTAATALQLRNTAALDQEQRRTELLELRQDLANDVHDSVAHHMSAIAMRSEAALHPHINADDREEALAAINGSARSALGDMRQLVEQLRDPDPSPTVRSIGDLERMCAAVGDSRIDVVAELESAVVAPEASTAAFLIVREGLTNARRHAVNATTIRVHLRCEAAKLVVEVADDGDASSPTRRVGSGTGLQSMVDRARSVGGTVAAGPHPEGGWRVRAELPVVTT